MNLVNRTVVEVRPLTPAELGAEFWVAPHGGPGGRGGRGQPQVIVFDDGSKVYAGADPEGNGPGVLFARAADGACEWVENKKAARRRQAREQT